MNAFIGVLALQGGVAPHLELLTQLGFNAREVRTADAISNAAGLVLPGGESTTQHKQIAHGSLGDTLDAFVREGRPVLATCAGLILSVARGYLDAKVERNAYGSQRHSFEAALDASEHRLSFIRAPAIRAIGPDVQVLATLGARPVVIQQARVIATTGHPELVGEGWLHLRAFGDCN